VLPVECPGLAGLELDGAESVKVLVDDMAPGVVLCGGVP
jgi:hypothetical protein